MPGVRVTTKVTLDGRVFRDPSGVIGKNIEAMLEDVSSEMEREVKRQIRQRAGSMRFYTGATTGSIRGRVESVRGRKWHRHAVVSAYTGDQERRGAIRTKAAAATIEARWHPFKKVGAASRRILRDMAKGLT